MTHHMTQIHDNRCCCRDKTGWSRATEIGLDTHANSFRKHTEINLSCNNYLIMIYNSMAGMDAFQFIILESTGWLAGKCDRIMYGTKHI